MNDISRHDRGEKGESLVYPVVSRRSGGLSLGINLFPQGKLCSFDCPYCEVAPFSGGRDFSIEDLDAELEAFFGKEYGRSWAPEPLRDICLSGNGEPTLSPELGPALEACARARRRFPRIAGAAPILIITNSTGFLDQAITELLTDFAGREGLSVWAKLDSGRQEDFAALSRSSYQLEDICDGIARFAREVPIVVQTMVCSLAGRIPRAHEAEAYAARIVRLLDSGARIEALHFYTVARSPLETWARPLSAEVIAAYMGMVGSRLGGRIPILGFDETGERPILPR